METLLKEAEIRVSACNELTAEQGRALYAAYVKRGLEVDESQARGHREGRIAGLEEAGGIIGGKISPDGCTLNEQEHAVNTVVCNLFYSVRKRAEELREAGRKNGGGMKDYSNLCLRIEWTDFEHGETLTKFIAVDLAKKDGEYSVTLHGFYDQNGRCIITNEIIEEYKSEKDPP